MAKAISTASFNARTYMELAIEEMRKSVAEARPDGKIAPKVGAVIVFPDGRVEKAHRGELREGDHAEYGLIERKLVNARLDECILFTTLEPCVERNQPKIACCKRTTKARIRTVYVGIGDPDPTVSGKGIKHLEESGAKVIMFDNDLQKIIETDNAAFLKQAIERKSKVVDTAPTVPVLERSVPNTGIADFSVPALEKFIAKAGLPYQPNDPDFYSYLEKLGVIVPGKGNGSYVPNAFGILLFGVNPRLHYKQAALKCTIDYGNGQTSVEEFSQPLVLVPDLVEEWLKKVLPAIKDTSSFSRRDVPAFPIDVLREAVINAIVHRDYKEEGVKAFLTIDPDKVEVGSPGAPLPSITIEQLKRFQAPSISRNPIIAYVFNQMHYVEELGLGMKTLKSLPEKYDLPLPEYSFKEPYLSLVFPRTLDAVKKVSNFKGTATLNTEELEGYEFIKLRGKVKRKEYELHFSFDTKKAERHLKKMVQLQLIERIGAGPGTFYQAILDAE